MAVFSQQRCRTEGSGGDDAAMHHMKLVATPAQLRRHREAGFTITELLVCISIIAILAAIAFTVGPKVMDRVHRAGCASNMRAQLAAFNLYAKDHNDKYYWPAVSGTVDNAPRFLYPDYISNLKAFICPATQHVIRENAVNRVTKRLVDLEDNSHGKHDKSGGYSYEYFAHFSIPAQYRRNPTDPFEVRKRPNHYWRDAHDTNLIVDCDDYRTGNYPDPGDNHDEHGWNWGWADGHVEWITGPGTAAAFARGGPLPKEGN